GVYTAMFVGGGLSVPREQSGRGHGRDTCDAHAPGHVTPLSLVQWTPAYGLSDIRPGGCLWLGQFFARPDFEVLCFAEADGDLERPLLVARRRHRELVRPRVERQWNT